MQALARGLDTHDRLHNQKVPKLVMELEEREEEQQLGRYQLIVNRFSILPVQRVSKGLTNCQFGAAVEQSTMLDVEDRSS